MAPILIWVTSLQSGHRHVGQQQTLAFYARCNVAKLHAGLPGTSMNRYVNHTALCEGQQPGQKSSSRKLCLTVSSIVIKIISSMCASFFISHSSATAMLHSESVLGLHYQSLPDSQGLASSSHACHCNSGSGPPP